MDRDCPGARALTKIGTQLDVHALHHAAENFGGRHATNELVGVWPYITFSARRLDAVEPQEGRVRRRPDHVSRFRQTRTLQGLCQLGDGRALGMDNGIGPHATVLQERENVACRGPPWYFVLARFEGAHGAADKAQEQERRSAPDDAGVMQSVRNLQRALLRRNVDDDRAFVQAGRV